MHPDILEGALVVIGLFFFTGCATANASVFVKWLVWKKSGSTIPLIGGMIGCVAFYFSPWLAMRSYWWLPLLLDASYAMLAIGIVSMLFRLKK